VNKGGRGVKGEGEEKEKRNKMNEYSNTKSKQNYKISRNEVNNRYKQGHIILDRTLLSLRLWDWNLPQKIDPTPLSHP
jgi:hypothetical protein